jgi:AcrR family transcriptional regulator
MGRYTRVMKRAQPPVRTRTASADVTDSLLEAALELLAEGGTDAITVRSVAQRADVAPMGVYSRFGSKDGLLEALFVEAFDRLGTAVGAASGPDAIARLRNGCRAYRVFAIENPHHYQLMFEQMLELELEQASFDHAMVTFTQLVGRIEDAMAAGELALADSVDRAQQVWSAMHGAVSLEIAGISFSNDSARTYDAMLDALLRGMRP